MAAVAASTLSDAVGGAPQQEAEHVRARMLVQNAGLWLGFRHVHVQLESSMLLCSLASETGAALASPVRAAQPSPIMSPIRTLSLGHMHTPTIGPAAGAPTLQVASSAAKRYGRRNMVVRRNVERMKIGIMTLSDAGTAAHTHTRTHVCALLHTAACIEDDETMMRVLQVAGALNEAVQRAVTASLMVVCVCMAVEVRGAHTHTRTHAHARDRAARARAASEDADVDTPEASPVSWRVVGAPQRCVIALEMPSASEAASWRTRIARAQERADDEHEMRVAADGTRGDGLERWLSREASDVGKPDTGVLDRLRVDDATHELTPDDLQQVMLMLQQSAEQRALTGDDPALLFGSPTAAEIAKPDTPDTAPTLPSPKALDSLDRVVTASTLALLRRMRTKPAYMFANPALAYALLIRAARDVDQHKHARTLLPAGVSQLGANEDDDAIWASVLADERDADDAAPDMPADATADAKPAAPAKPRNNRRLPELQHVLRREHWLILAARYLPVLADRYSAGQVFDSLVDGQPPVTLRDLSIAPTVVAAGHDDRDGLVSLQLSSATERVLRYDMFERYVNALARPLVTPPAAWESLRDLLELDSQELVVKVEEMVELTVSITMQVSFVLGASRGVGGRSGDSQGTTKEEVVVLPASSVCDFPLLTAPFAATPRRRTTSAQKASSRHADGTVLRLGRGIREFVEHGDKLEADARDKDFDESCSTNASSSADEAQLLRRSRSRLLRRAGSKGTAVQHQSRSAAALLSGLRRLLPGGGVEDDAEEQVMEAEINAIAGAPDAAVGAVVAEEDSHAARVEARTHASTMEHVATNSISTASTDSVIAGDVASTQPRSGGIVSFIRSGAERVRSLASSATRARSNPATLPPRPAAAGASLPGEKVTAGEDGTFAKDASVHLQQTGVAEIHLTGTLILTDRNLYFHANRNEVLVMPLNSITDGVQVCRTNVRTLGMQLGRTSDNGLCIPKVQVRRVPLDPEADEDSMPTPLQMLFGAAAAMRGAPVTFPRDRLSRSRAGSAAVASATPGMPLSHPARDGSGTLESSSAAASPLVTSPMTTPALPAVTGVADVPELTLLHTARPKSYSTDSHARVRGALFPRASVTLAFSKVKDFVLSRGEERTGGRRLVIKEALEEIASAHRVAEANERVLQELVYLHRNELRTSGDRTGRARQPESVPGLPFRMSPHLLAAAKAGLTVGKLWALPFRVSAWKEQLRSDRSSEQVFQRRLQLLASLNVIRTRAILKATGHCIDELYVCKRYLAGEDERAAEIIRAFMLQDDPRWLLRLTTWLCHDKRVRRRRWESLQSFDRRIFKYEWDTLVDNVLHPINRTRHIVMYIVQWETPALTAAVVLVLVLMVWHDMQHYALPIWLFLHALQLLVYGAMDPATKAWLAQVLDRPRTPKGNTLLERLRNFRASLALAQVRMHKLNTYALKLKGLVTWRDPARTRVYVALLVLAALVLTVVPARWVLTAILLLVFTKPLRSPEPGIFGLLLRRFWHGLPVPSRSDAVYAHLDAHTDSLAMARSAADGDGREWDTPDTQGVLVV